MDQFVWIFVFWNLCHRHPHGEIYLFFDDCFLNILPKLHQYIKTRVKLNP